MAPKAKRAPPPLPLLTYTFESDDLSCFDGIKEINGLVKDPAGKKVAVLNAFVVSRRMLNGKFLERLEAYSGMSQAPLLFDKNGLLKAHMLQGPYRRGTGCWGEELNDGALLCIEELEMKKFRRQGVASELFRKLLETEHCNGDEPVYHVIISPHDFDGASIPFVRKNGFRRIGRTALFGYSRNGNHASRSVPISDDAQKCLPVFKERMDFSDDEMSGLYSRSPSPKPQPQLHKAICADKSPSIIETIKAVHQRDAASLHERDAMDLLPMHVALQTKNFMAYKALLILGCTVDLKDHESKDGSTPLDKLRDTMYDDRVSEGKRWRGYSDEVLSVEYEIKTKTNIETGSASVEEYIAKTKFGCTCGECVEGWLSPRMGYQLEYQASYSLDMMPHCTQLMFTGSHPLDRSQYELVLNADFIPPALYPDLTVTFYRGYQEVIRAARDLLKTRIVTVVNAESVMILATSEAYHTASAHFLRRGGRVEHALDALTGSAKDQGMLGDREFFRLCGESERFESLPRCANDHDFGLVRERMGLRSENTWGPYFGGEDSSDDDDDLLSGDEFGMDEETMMAAVREAVASMKPKTKKKGGGRK